MSTMKEQIITETELKIEDRERALAKDRQLLKDLDGMVSRRRRKLAEEPSGHYKTITDARLADYHDEALQLRANIAAHLRQLESFYLIIKHMKEDGHVAR